MRLPRLLAYCVAFLAAGTSVTAAKPVGSCDGPRAAAAQPDEWNLGSGTCGTSRLRKREDTFFLRIMPLGASITQGVFSSDETGYRKSLRQQLRFDGWEVNMAGSRHNGSMSDNVRVIMIALEFRLQAQSHLPSLPLTFLPTYSHSTRPARDTQGCFPLLSSLLPHADLSRYKQDRIMKAGPATESTRFTTELWPLFPLSSPISLPLTSGQTMLLKTMTSTPPVSVCWYYSSTCGHKYQMPLSSSQHSYRSGPSRTTHAISISNTAL